MKKLIEHINSIELSYLVGIALLTTMLYGLAINSLLPLFGIKNPLDIHYIWPLYFLLVPFIVKGTWSLLNCRLGTLRVTHLLDFAAILNPLISAVGTIYLNNTGNNSLTVLSTGLTIVIFVAALSLTGISKHAYTRYIFSAALSLIFSFSLRSNYLNGWDIHQEYLVFKLSAEKDFWTMDSFRDAYNACLSITILPTIIKNLTGVDSLSVFKVIYPFLLSVIPALCYSISRHFLSTRYSYAAAFIFLIQSQFINQMPALLRQGVAFIFFALMLDVVLTRDKSTSQSQLLFIIFSVGMVLSHYSTTYMAIGMLGLSLLIRIILEKLLKNKIDSVLTVPIFILLLLLTFIWNGLITKTSRAVSNSVAQVASNIEHSYSLENKSEMVTNIFNKTLTNSQLIDEYNSVKMAEATDRNQYKNSQILPINVDVLRLNKFSHPMRIYFHIFIPWMIRISLILGALIYIFNHLRQKQKFDEIALAVSLVSVVVFALVFPFFSVSYNLERLMQQTLLYLSAFIIVGIQFVLKTVRISKLSSLLIIILATSYLLQTSGYIDRYIFGLKTLRFDNNGEQYLRYYTKSTEVSGLKWIESRLGTPKNLNIDRYAQLRMKAYTQRKFDFVNTEINPPTLGPTNYVVAGTAANAGRVAFSQFSNQIIRYLYPYAYLNLQKNLVYSNSGTQIYK